MVGVKLSLNVAESDERGAACVDVDDVSEVGKSIDARRSALRLGAYWVMYQHLFRQTRCHGVYSLFLAHHHFVHRALASGDCLIVRLLAWSL